MPAVQRLPSKERKISEIDAGDSRISVVGTVVGVSGGIVAVDDGSGKIDVSFEEPPNARPGQTVRAMGKLIPLEGGLEIQGEALQDFTGADLDVWRKVSGLWEGSLKQL